VVDGGFWLDGRLLVASCVSDLPPPSSGVESPLPDSTGDPFLTMADSDRTATVREGRKGLQSCFLFGIAWRCLPLGGGCNIRLVYTPPDGEVTLAGLALAEAAGLRTRQAGLSAGRRSESCRRDAGDSCRRSALGSRRSE
jgi:hypothetical protein